MCQYIFEIPININKAINSAYFPNTPDRNTLEFSLDTALFGKLKIRDRRLYRYYPPAPYPALS